MSSQVVQSRLKTIENDGSVSDDPCQNCDGRLVLRRARNGGWFLGCDKFPVGCTFKMAPNSEELADREEAKALRKLVREKKRAARDAEYAKKLAEKKRFLPPPPSYCEGCFSSLSNVDVQAGLSKHRRC